MAFEYLIEGRGGGNTAIRVVHSGLLGDDWQDEYDALRRGRPFHLHTLREYLAHFPGRTAVPVFAAAPAAGRTDPEVRSALAHAPSPPLPVAPGTRARAPNRPGCRRWTARRSGRTTSASNSAPPTDSTPSTTVAHRC
ncbi:hypothetical protein [Kitasatospora sp. NPDC017646]|uniref:hypothetical protein n=1 Tax=Kitasatospora sp. NPDC017646 TaxID=3364024 RepID=UPI0037A9F72D